MKTYTVILLRSDYIADEFGKDTYMTHVEATSVENAEITARAEVDVIDYEGATEDELEGMDHYDYAVLCVIEGKHMDIKTP